MAQAQLYYDHNRYTVLFICSKCVKSLLGVQETTDPLLHPQYYKPPTTKKVLQQEYLQCSVGVHKFLKVYYIMGSTGRQPGFGRPSKITVEIKEIVENP